MGKLRDLCTEVKQTKHVMTFTDIAQALANGAAMGEKVHDPLSGAVLNLSLEAGKRAVCITEELLKDLAKKKPVKTTPVKSPRSKKRP